MHVVRGIMEHPAKSGKLPAISLTDPFIRIHCLLPKSHKEVLGLEMPQRVKAGSKELQGQALSCYHLVLLPLTPLAGLSSHFGYFSWPFRSGLDRNLDEESRVP